MLSGEIGWAYVAGFFDGEGCVRAYPRPGRLTGQQCFISITQTGKRGEEVLKEIQTFILNYGIKSSVCVHKHKNPKWTDVWALFIRSNPGVVAFIGRAMPYLRVKKVEALDVWRFIRWYGVIPKDSPLKSMLLREHWRNPGVRERRSAGIRRAWAEGRMPQPTPQSRENMSKAQKLRWEKIRVGR